MKTLQMEWNEYRNKCYPPNIGAIQNKELHQSFFAGALCMMILMEQLSKIEPKEQQDREFVKLRNEAVERCKYIAALSEQKN
jgi:hypothetical protein